MIRPRSAQPPKPRRPPSPNRAASASTPKARRGKGGVTRIVRDSYGSPKEWYSLGKEIRKRDEGRCLFCRVKEDPKNGVYHEVHHIKRLADGGTTTKANLCLCCKDCHKKRPGHGHML